VRINLNLDYKLKDSEKAQFGGENLNMDRICQEVSDWVIRRAIETCHPKMDTDKARRYAKIQDALAEVGSDNRFIEVDGTLFDFILNAVEKAELPSGASSWKITMLDHLESLKKQEAEKKPRLQEAKER